jgi:GxxExxY protein
MEKQDDPLTREIIGAAIEVHRALGPGLLESAYERCLARELTLRNFEVEQQVEIRLEYKGVQLECVYRMDLVVDRSVLIEVKATEKLLPIHDAQVLTYLKLTGLRHALLLNFNTPYLREGIKRLAL